MTICTFLFVNEKCTIKNNNLYSMFQGFIFSIIIIKNNVFYTKRMYGIGRIKYMRT